MLQAQLAPLALAASATARCIDTLIPLHLSSTNFDISDPSFNTTYPVSGTFKVEVQFCPPTNATAARAHSDTLLISLPGSTYGTEYWNFPFKPEANNFVRYANARGFTVLNVARIGSGRSDHPDPEKVLQVGLQVASEVELAKLARKGAIPGAAGKRYTKLVGLGHSLSSTILNGVVNNAPEVLDGAVFTGFGHVLDPPGVFPGISARDTNLTRFAGLPAGYLTTVDTSRDSRGAFYGPDGTFDPAVLAYDEAHKDLVSQGEWHTIPAFVKPAPGFLGHVLAANGLEDAFACIPPACDNIQDEAKAYPNAATFETAVIKNSGHDLNLHYIAPEFFQTIVSWLERHGF